MRCDQQTISNTRSNLARVLFFCLLAPQVVIAQTITDILINAQSDPVLVLVSGQALPGFTSRVETEATGDQFNTQVIRLYFKHCLPFSTVDYFEELVSLDADAPFDLCIYTYYDSTQISTTEPLCYFNYPDIIPGDTLCLTYDQVLSANEVVSDRKDFISAFPNPSTGVVNLEGPEGIHIKSISLFDLTGRELAMWSGNRDELDISSFNPGIYLIVVDTDRGLIQKKILKQ